MINDRDATGLDALEELVLSDGWRLVVERVKSMLDTARDELEGAHLDIRGPYSVEGLQGKARTLRTVLDLPAILKAELEEELKR
jgi:hypothetical protein